MKKLIVLGVALLVGLCFSGLAQAETANDTVGVLITVNPSFTFAIGESVVDMGTVAEGSGGSGSVTMYCGTNHNLPWTVQVKSGTIASGANLIPLSNFKFYTFVIAGEGAGTCVGTATALTLIDQLAYTAALSEYSDTDVRVNMGFVLDVPWSTPSGTYAATVTATMVE
ncbi:MAG: hypothetical protein KKD29_02575 [Candidatus Omnitrophica bacterium]|nr:hypothetical protein [Candidatus Omnitrophota bacterium]MBU4488982.1 hypothetical protein [Candidatus Omnitrophota bacterium]MCG2705696.1 hypothetical protein [Candidatus Omnitrophota bacterium]